MNEVLLFPRYTLVIEAERHKRPRKFAHYFHERGHASDVRGREEHFSPFISTEEFFLDGSEVNGLAPLGCGCCCCCCCCRLDVEVFRMPLLLLLWLPPPPTAGAAAVSGTWSVEDPRGDIGGTRRSGVAAAAAAGEGGSGDATAGAAAVSKVSLALRERPTSCNTLAFLGRVLRVVFYSLFPFIYLQRLSRTFGFLLNRHWV